MISKNSRRATGSVERLKQGGFTGVKGIDVNGSVLATDTVFHTKNLDVHLDGSLTLRKPVICTNEIPEVLLEDEVISTDLVYYGHLFDKDYTIVVRKDSEGNQYLGIFKDSTPNTVRLHWMSWQDYTSYYKTLEPYSSNGFYKLTFLDLKNLSTVNTATSSVITNVFVDIANSTFIRPEAPYSDEHSTDLFYSKLYDYNTDTETISVFKPRTLTLSKSTSFNIDFDLNITTPDINTINTSDVLNLDVNLDLDNPYSIRDVYNTSAPTVKGILPYIPTYTQSKHTVVSPENISERSDTVDSSASVINHATVPYVDTPNIASDDIYIFGNSDKSINIRVHFKNESDRYGAHTLCGNIVSLKSTTCWANVYVRIVGTRSDGRTIIVPVRFHIGDLEGDGGYVEDGKITTYADWYTDMPHLFYFSYLDFTFPFYIEIGTATYEDGSPTNIPSTLYSKITNLDGYLVGQAFWEMRAYKSPETGYEGISLDNLAAALQSQLVHVTKVTPYDPDSWGDGRYEYYYTNCEAWLTFKYPQLQDGVYKYIDSSERFKVL